MRSCNGPSLLLIVGVLAAGSAAADGRAWLLGGGFQLDSEDGVAITALGDLQLGDQTWLSGTLGRTRVELPRGMDAQTLYGDLSIDHFFDPAGLRLGVAYWGDSDLLDSIDVRGSIYSRGERTTLTIDLEHREFELEVPSIGQFPARAVGFSALGAGLSAAFGITDTVNLQLSGMRYEYDVDLRIEDSNRLANLLSVSRLSLLSSLIDWRMSAGMSIDSGLKRWYFDVSNWRGSIDGSDNVGATVSFLTPMTDRTDVELRLGYDDSDLYGDVTILSVFVYFYGG